MVSKIGSFSFYSLNFTKNLSSITGGIIKTNNSNFKALKDIIFRTNFSVFHNIKNFLALFLIKLISYKYIYNTFNFLLTSNEKPIRKIFDLNYKLQTKKKIPNYYLNNLSYNNYNILNYSIKKLPKENIIRIANNLKYFRLLKRKKTITNLIPKRNLNLVTLEYPILFKSKKIKNLFITELKKNKLDIRKKYYTNCSEINIFKKFKKNKTPNSEKVEKNIICLPNHPAISKDMIKEYSRLIK